MYLYIWSCIRALRPDANSVEAVVPVFREVCGVAAETDGMAYDPETVAGVAIKEDADYSGVRVTFLGTLQAARVPMQVDVGFADVVTPGPVPTVYPTILEYPAPALAGYPRETVVAEKFEAMVHLGILNSRMKDFYDLWLLARRFDFDGPTLSAAVARTFANRKTVVPLLPVALTPAFAVDPGKQAQWKGFVRKSKLADDVPADIAAVTGGLAPFLLPVAGAVAAGTALELTWRAPGPWA